MQIHVFYKVTFPKGNFHTSFMVTSLRSTSASSYVNKVNLTTSNNKFLLIYAFNKTDLNAKYSGR